MKFQSLFLCLCWLAGSAGLAAYTNSAGPFELRGYGKVSVSGRSDGRSALSIFQCESPEKAKIVASKYFTDLQNYGAVERVSGCPGMLAVRHGGVWRIGIDGSRVMVLSAPDRAALDTAAAGHGADRWQPPPENGYPRYLDNFDNAALAIWWMGSTKTPEQMKFFRENPVIANLHQQSLSTAYAPNVFENALPRNAAAQLRREGKPYRTMLWTDDGKSAWYSWMNMPGDEFEAYVPGFTGKSLFEAAGYYTNHTASEFLDDLQLNALYRLMDRWKGDPDLLAWMEPHGEFQLFLYSRPPHSGTRFPEYLQKDKGYTLDSLSRAWTGKPGSFRSWHDVTLPDPAWFKGRRGSFLDLDDIDWKWKSGTLEAGEQAGFFRPDYSDAGWFSAPRTDRRLLVFVGRYNHVPGEASPKADSLWTRFSHDVPAPFLKAHSRIYLHIMPLTERNCRELTVWVNGQEAARKLVDPENWASNTHSEVEISRYLKPGRNDFAIFSQGGRIAYRVFLSPHTGGSYPYADAGINRRFLDWRDYLRQAKLKTLETWLRAMRSVDPERPIKVMTPNQWQSEAFDLFEKYGAYPQLTGETTWYRPMHYKGYTMLRNRSSSSEPGGFVKDPKNGQHMYAMAFWEAQDAHDYGFDFARDFWRYPEVVRWWADNAALLSTFGKTDLIRTDLGVLRDTAQDSNYGTGLIWNWDMSRGTLPALGLTPVLVDGRDLEKGLADGKVAVMFDCATTVMTPQLVAAVKRYVRQGGVFIAQHHTGRHTPEQRDAWPLPAAFGLKVKDKGGSGAIRFSSSQKLFPKLRGKELQGSGASIDHLGRSASGQVAIRGKADAVATWPDGSMAIAEVAEGKGKFILLGTPFYLRIKDDNGKWLNEAARQKLVEELLASLGVRREMDSSRPEIWFAKRASKNGLYDVYFAGALSVRGGDWTLDTRIDSRLSALRPAPAAVIDATKTGTPDVPVTNADGKLSFGVQSFSPYQIRQFAAVRQNAGVDGPVHWLRNQERNWFALPQAEAVDRGKTEAAVRAYAARLGEDGLDLSTGWQARPEGGEWRSAGMGSFLEQGFPDGTRRVLYRKNVTLPPEWLDGNSRIFLCFGAYGEWPHQTGLSDRGDVRIGGRPFVSGARHSFRRELTPELLKTGRLELELEVAAAPKPGSTPGPVGAMYLHKFPKPEAVLDLAGEWTAWKNVLESSGSVTVPYRGRLFGLSREVMIPEAWRGKLVRLVIDEPPEAAPNARLRNLILNHDGYLKERTFASPGARIDRYLKPGEINRIDLFGAQLDSRGNLFSADLRGIRLEVYSLK